MIPNNILITGCKGQLGSDMMAVLAKKHRVIGIDIEDLDIRDYKKTIEYLKKIAPDVVIHIAAYTDVDGCEINPETATEINATGTKNIVSACLQINAKIIYFSTDYIFDGTKGSPYLESDQPNPKTVYGKSKLEGEKRIVELTDNYAILRIAWLYGAYGKNFLKTILKIGAEQISNKKKGKSIGPIQIVDDQVGNPTWTIDIVKQTETIINNDLKGIFHCTSEGEVSWYGFASDIFRMLKMNVELNPCTTEEYSRPASRPRYSSLENKNLKDGGLNVMRDYEIALQDFLKQYEGKLSLLDVT